MSYPSQKSAEDVRKQLAALGLTQPPMGMLSGEEHLADSDSAAGSGTRSSGSSSRRRSSSRSEASPRSSSRGPRSTVSGSSSVYSQDTAPRRSGSVSGGSNASWSSSVHSQASTVRPSGSSGGGGHHSRHSSSGASGSTVSGATRQVSRPSWSEQNPGNATRQIPSSSAGGAGSTISRSSSHASRSPARGPSSNVSRSSSHSRRSDSPRRPGSSSSAGSRPSSYPESELTYIDDGRSETGTLVSVATGLGSVATGESVSVLGSFRRAHGSGSSHGRRPTQSVVSGRSGSVISSTSSRASGSYVGSGSRRGGGSVLSTATTNAGPEGVIFWPDIKATIRSDADLHKLTLLCPVCSTSMRSEETRTRNICKILHCGHMICGECCIRICANVDADPENPYGRVPECPFCKVQIGRRSHCYEGCNKAGNIGFLLPRNMQELALTPLCMPEGASHPIYCPWCRIQRAEELVSELASVIVNDETARVCFTPMRDGDASRVEEDYVALPEFQRLIDHMLQVFRDPELTRRYTGIYLVRDRPDDREIPKTAVVQMLDRSRFPK